MPECEGCHEDVKRITKYWKTGQWLREMCVADLEKPPVRTPPASSISDENRKGDTVTYEAVLAEIQMDR